MKNIILSTTDINKEYEILGLVSSHISTTGMWDNRSFVSYIDEYPDLFESNGEKSFFKIKAKYGHSEIAFRIGCEELKKRALELEADAVVGISFIHDGFFGGGAQGEVLYTMYGTAVKFK